MLDTNHAWESERKLDMRIVALETLRLNEFPNLLWVRLHTDKGYVGIGETFFGAQAVESYLHESVAPYLLGQDPRDIQRHARALRQYVGFCGTGVEQRGNSAIDLALWDLIGRATGQPLYQALGGRVRTKIPVYNTCAGYRYIRAQPRQAVENWGLPENPSEGPYEDLEAFLTRPDALARDLLAMGIRAMKIWPFDPEAERTNGQFLSLSDLERCLEPFQRIRATVGQEMELLVELHGLWNLPMAVRIARALEPLKPLWIEDPIRSDDLDALATLARATPIPLALSETLGPRSAFRQLLEQRIPGFILFDLGWCGGPTEARAIAAMAEAYQLPVAPHDCTGPIVLTGSVHFSLSIPNSFIQEFVRAFYFGWYQEIVTNLPPFANGLISAPEEAGLGTDLRPELWERSDAHIRISH